MHLLRSLVMQREESSTSGFEAVFGNRIWLILYLIARSCSLHFPLLLQVVQSRQWLASKSSKIIFRYFLKSFSVCFYNSCPLWAGWNMQHPIRPIHFQPCTYGRHRKPTIRNGNKMSEAWCPLFRISSRRFFFTVYLNRNSVYQHILSVIHLFSPPILRGMHKFQYMHRTWYICFESINKRLFKLFLLLRPQDNFLHTLSSLCTKEASIVMVLSFWQFPVGHLLS